MIELEVPPGSTRQQIEEWLDGQGIEFQYIADVRSGEPLGSHGRDVSGFSGMIVGHVQDTGGLRFKAGKIRAYFLLGSDDRLAELNVIWTGTD